MDKTDVLSRPIGSLLRIVNWFQAFHEHLHTLARMPSCCIQVLKERGRAEYERIKKDLLKHLDEAFDGLMKAYEDRENEK